MKMNARRGEKNNMWKGDTVGYHGLHKRMRQLVPRPEKCQMCNESLAKELANVSGKYLTEIRYYAS